MKYYAVTEDPNELMHYGVKGMKWGQHIFGDKQIKSSGYKKAVSKLRASMKDGIKRSQAHWRKSAEQKQQKQAAKQAQFNASAQARLDEALGNQAIRSARKEQNAIRREIRKDVRAERREDRQMEKYLQKARHGTLKYKKLRDDQIDTIAERLNRENMARRLSGNETPHMLTRIKRAVGEGVVRGVGSAVAVGIEENARARAQYKAQQKYGAARARMSAKEQHIRDRQKARDDIKNKRDNAFAEAQLASDKEYYTELAKTGERRQFLDVFGITSGVRRRSRERNLQARKDFKDQIANTNKMLEERNAEAAKRKQEEEAMERRITEYARKQSIMRYLNSANVRR